MKEDNHTIKFYLGEETAPVIEGLDRLDESIFHYQIRQALTVLASRLGDNPSENENNNIIAFIGERGAGKTSCMYSTIKVLSDFNNTDCNRNRKKHINNDIDNILIKKRFSFIETIDPSFFDTKHNIIELVIGKMYSKVKELEKGDHRNDEIEHQYLHFLLKEFQMTKTHLRYISSDLKLEDDTMEELAYLSSGIDLKHSMQKLITAFLKYNQSDVLVISLDDIDLNTMQAYTMVEQIRKYLILPNVAIFMAIKLDQLSNVIRLELSKQFNDLLRIEQVSFSEIVEMSERYLMKLIPLQSRIYLPMPETFFNHALEIYDDQQSLLVRFDSIKQSIPQLIYEKCRYLFYNTRGTTSLIVPRNLRELRMLIRMLIIMPEYIKNSTITSGNKQIFKRYFFGSWLDSLNKDNRDIANAILAENEPTLFNKTVIQELFRLYFNNNKQNIPDHFHDIVDIQNLSFNVSLGDCFYFMNYIESINLSPETKKLLFFIKSVYSIRLYEYYDELTDALRDNTIPQIQDDTNSKIDNQPYRAEILEQYSIDDFIETIYERLYLEIYGGKIPTIRSYCHSMNLRGDDPYYYLDYQTIEKVKIPFGWDSVCFDMTLQVRESRSDAVARELYFRYHFDKNVRIKGDEVINFTLSNDYINVIKMLQDKMIHELTNRHIIVECCPTSNLKIGSFNRYDEHPMYRFFDIALTKPSNNQLQVTINTDDQGIFATSLDNEYALTVLSLLKKKNDDGNFCYSRHQVLKWLNEVYENSNKYKFMTE